MKLFRKRLESALITMSVLTLVAGVVDGVTATSAGAFTGTDVNTAVAKGVANIDGQQNPNGSFGISVPGAETASAIIAYGVLDKGDFHNLSATMQTHLHNAVTWLLSQQSADGSFATDGYPTYDTGLALDGLSSSKTVDPGVPAAIAKGRAYLIKTQQAPPSVTGNPSSPNCSTTDQPPAFSGSDFYCGGWNYDAGPGRSDESNTGFALTGLAVTGGVPAAAAGINVGWQRHIQELTATNYYATRNDGGGDYEPGTGSGDFSSNANDTGSLLFGLGDDGVAAGDAKVAAAMKLGTDVLNEYELMKSTVRSMIFHSGMNEDGTCTIGNAGCDWNVGFDGGYHYSIWALTKGLGHYITANLADPTNWYAKVVDLLLTQQASDGSWPQDGRDDGTGIMATSFAVDALGLVGVVPPPPPSHNAAIFELDLKHCNTIHIGYNYFPVGTVIHWHVNQTGTGTLASGSTTTVAPTGKTMHFVDLTHSLSLKAGLHTHIYFNWNIKGVTTRYVLTRGPSCA